VVTWWPDNAPDQPAKHPLGVLAQRRVTDSAAAEAPQHMLAGLAAAYQPGDTDFAWTRATPWRTLLAATLDQAHPEITGGEIAAEEGNPTADLIAAWLSLRLGVPVARTDSGGPGITRSKFITVAGDIQITRADGRTATLAWPGRSDRSVALHRRDIPELLAEELRRLDPDEVYAETLHYADTHPAPAIEEEPYRELAEELGDELEDELGDE
jgi:glucose-6-phosphate dehydrogenase assembly protein OpcA